MTESLLERDEEVDANVYQAYLRAQSDIDLMDILRHLDPERYPARLDAAWRESRRRHVLQAPVYTAKEYAIRGIAVAMMILSVVTLALALILTPAEALRPAWPIGIPDGTSTSVIIRMFSIGVLRGIIYWSTQWAIYPIGFGALGYWLVTRGPHLHGDQIRKGVWSLVLFTQTLLLTAMIVTAFSAIPLVFTSTAGEMPFWERAVSLLHPWFL